MLNLKAPMCNRSVNLKLDGYTLNFVFSDKQNRPFYMTSFEHLHSSFEIHVIIEGTCKLKTATEERELLPDTVVVIPPKTTHFITEFSEGCKKIDLRVNAVSDDGTAENLPFGHSAVTVCPGCERTGAYARDLYEAMSYSGRNGEVVTKSALTLMYFSVLKELGLDNFLVRGLIKSSGRVKRLVTYVGKKELSYEEYIEATKSKRRFFGLIKKKEKPEEATKEESSVKLEKIDFTTAKFYLCDRESEETKNLIDARKTSILNMVLFCILILCIFVFLMVLMPSILNVIDDFLANSKVK